jgi:hypothetical protein
MKVSVKVTDQTLPGLNQLSSRDVLLGQDSVRRFDILTQNCRLNYGPSLPISFGSTEEINIIQ